MEMPHRDAAFFFGENMKGLKPYLIEIIALVAAMTALIINLVRAF